MSAAEKRPPRCGVLVPAGDEKGVPIEECSRKALELTASFYTKRASDPARVGELVDSRRAQRLVLEEVKRRDTPAPAMPRPAPASPAAPVVPANIAAFAEHVGDRIVRSLIEQQLTAEPALGIAHAPPPHDLDSERIVLSHRLLPGLDDAVFEGLAPSDFFDPWHRVVAEQSLPPRAVVSIDDLIKRLDDSTPYTRGLWEKALEKIHDKAPALSLAEEVRAQVERVVFLAHLRELHRRLALLVAKTSLGGELAQPMPVAEACAAVFETMKDSARPFYIDPKRTNT